jgi:hypothetical protein
MSILRKPKADITINIPEGPLHPGSTINTVVRVSAKESFSIRSGSVEFACTEVYWQIVHTGKSTHQQKRKHKLFKIKEMFIGNTNFTMGTSIKKSVKLIIPDGLPSTVSGKTVNINWQLKASLDIIKMRDITKKLELIVLPIATAIPVFEGIYPGPSNKASSSSEEGKLILSLESEFANGGENLHGSFETKVERDISAREIRVELEVKESAGSKSTKVIADSVKLEEQVHLAGGYYRKWRFELKIPDSPPPTTSTNKSSVIWTVKGIIDKSWKRDFSVNYPIQVY